MRVRSQNQSARPSGKQSGHTLIELMVVTTLMTLLTFLVAQVWRPLSVTTNSLRLRSAASTEIGIAKEFLRQDFGGVEVAKLMPNGDLLLRREFEIANRIRSLGSGDHDPGVQYRFKNGNLMRRDLLKNEEFEVAHGLENFSVVPQSNGDLNISLSGGEGKDIHQLTLIWRP